MHLSTCLNIIMKPDSCTRIKRLSTRWQLCIFIQAISIALFKSIATQRRSRHSTDTVPEFRSQATQATLREGLDQGLYLSGRAGVDLMTLRTKGGDSTNTTPTPSIFIYLCNDYIHVQSRSHRLL